MYVICFLGRKRFLTIHNKWVTINDDDIKIFSSKRIARRTIKRYELEYQKYRRCSLQYNYGLGGMHRRSSKKLGLSKIIHYDKFLIWRTISS